MLISRPLFSIRFVWFVGHLTLLACTIRYGFSYFTFHPSTRTARFSYRTAFVAAAVTYGIVVFKAYRARSRSGKVQQTGLLAFAGDENVQYLGKSLAFTDGYTFASWPFYKALSPSGALLTISFLSASNGARVALLSTGSTRVAPLHDIFCVPRSNIYPYKPHSNFPTPKIVYRSFSRRPPSQIHLTPCRTDWEFCQEKLRHFDDASSQLGTFPLVPGSILCDSIYEG